MTCNSSKHHIIFIFCAGSGQRGAGSDRAAGAAGGKRSQLCSAAAVWGGPGQPQPSVGDRQVRTQGTYCHMPALLGSYVRECSIIAIFVIIGYILYGFAMFLLLNVVCMLTFALSVA